MEITDILRDVRRAVREYPPLVAQSIEAVWDGETKDALRFLSPQLEPSVSLKLSVVNERLRITATGDDDETNRLLRNNLIGLSKLRSRPQEHHFLQSFPLDEISAVLSSTAAWAQQIRLMFHTTRQVSAGESPLPETSALVYWWDARANFGDAAGPWLVRAMTGKHVINARSTDATGRALGSIGSLFQMLNRSNTDMWGSGILYPPTEGQIRKLKRLKGIEVHAVRGPKTRSLLQEQIGWEIPEVYGDPALLFPRYLQPKEPQNKDQIAFVPHKHHRKYFKGRIASNVKNLTVADDVETVVKAIATSAVCVSTSLHGIIFAQAYGVPWVWLNVADDELKGGDFKFEDFFATLDATAVSRHDVPVDALDSLDLQEIAQKASLPDLLIDLDALEAAFPLARPHTDAASNSVSFTWDTIPGEERAVAMSRVAYREQERLLNSADSWIKRL